MHLLYCDESNLEERAGDFLIYAGITVPADRASALSLAISQLRADRGIAVDALVKFNPVAPPLTHAEYRDFKQALIETAIHHDCRVLAYAVLHNLARNPDKARRFGINTLCWHFHCVLNRLDAPGLILIDRFNDERNEVDAQLRERMARGVELRHRGGYVPLDRIVGYHYAAIGQAHFTSLSDIVVGSLRWAINVHCREQEHREAALNLLGIMSPLFWREHGQDEVPDIGFCFSPFNIRNPRYHDTYIRLQQFLRDGGIASSQNIRLDQ